MEDTALNVFLRISRSRSVIHTAQPSSRPKTRSKQPLSPGFPYQMQINTVEREKKRHKLSLASQNRAKTPTQRAEEEEKMSEEEIRRVLEREKKKKKQLLKKRRNLEQKKTALQEETQKLDRKLHVEMTTKWQSLLSFTNNLTQSAQNQVEILKEELTFLSKTQKNLENTLKSATELKNRLENTKKHIVIRHSFGFQADLDKAKPRNLTELYGLLWVGFLSDPDLNQKYLKTDLKSLFLKKSRLEIEYILENYPFSFTKRELSVILAQFTTEKRVNTVGFIEKLTEFQPFLLFEDIESEISSFRIHFSVLNWSKFSLKSYLTEKLPPKATKSKGISLLTAKPIFLDGKIAGKIVENLWKGRKTLEKEVDLGEIPDWELSTEVVKRSKLLFMCNNTKFEEIERKITSGIPLKSVFSLSSDRFSILESLFSQPFASFSVIFSPSWQTEAEIGISTQFETLARVTDLSTIIEIAGKVPVMSQNCVFLPEFFIQWETQLGNLTEAQKTAVELFSFRETDSLDSLPLEKFADRIAGCTLQPESYLPPKQPQYTSEDEETSLSMNLS